MGSAELGGVLVGSVKLGGPPLGWLEVGRARWTSGGARWSSYKISRVPFAKSLHLLFQNHRLSFRKIMNLLAQNHSISS